MSLVVAQAHDTSIVLVSDTQVSSPTSQKLGIFEGAIKCVVLDSHCAIAFAGEILVARGAFEALETLEEVKRNRDGIINEMLKQHLESKGVADFLLAFMSPPELVSVKEGEVRRNCRSAWIGEKAGFEAFQTALHSPINMPASTIHSRLFFDTSDLPQGLVTKMLDAMDAVSADTSLPTIGGLAIAAIGSGGIFRYAEHIALGARFHGRLENGTSEILSRGATTGQCTVFASFVIDAEGYLYPITYFVEANLLLVHPTRISMTPRAIRAHSFDEALHILQEKAHLYSGTSLPRQDNYIREISKMANLNIPGVGEHNFPPWTLTQNQWRPGGHRTPVAIRVLEINIQFDNTPLSNEEVRLVKYQKFFLVHSDGHERYSPKDMYQRLVFEYPWLPVMTYGQTLRVTVLGPSDESGRQLVKADVGGRLLGLKMLAITASVHALPETEWH